MVAAHPVAAQPDSEETRPIYIIRDLEGDQNHKTTLLNTFSTISEGFSVITHKSVHYIDLHRYSFGKDGRNVVTNSQHATSITFFDGE